MTKLVDILEEIVLPCFYRLSIARVNDRYVVLSGHRDRRAEWDVDGPFETLHKARNHAHQLQLRAYEGEQLGAAS